MESKITNQQFGRSDPPLAEPHFTEEATLLSARPVVPLSELTSEAGFSRRWVLGFGLAGGLMLGVLTAAFYYTRLLISEPQSRPGVEAAFSGVEGVTSGPVAISELPPPPRVTESAKATQVKTQSPSVSWSTRPLLSHKGALKKAAQPRVEVVRDEVFDLDYETRDERRAARRERKERNREGRERRVSGRASELLRIREIFEGPRRP
jgi:hypothetical protein